MDSPPCCMELDNGQLMIKSVIVGDNVTVLHTSEQINQPINNHCPWLHILSFIIDLHIHTLVVRW